MPGAPTGARACTRSFARWPPTWRLASTSATDLGTALASRLRALTQVKHVQVTEVPINAPLRAGHPVMTHDYAAFAVPTRSGRQLVLEVSFLPGVRPDDWTCQLLETAASLAAITLRGGARDAARARRCSRRITATSGR